MTRRLAVLLLAISVAACGGGSGGTSSAPPGTIPADFLTVDDVQRVIAQATGEAQVRGAPAHIAVVDRVGNVLAIFRMNGASTATTISSGLGITGGLEGAGTSSMDAAVSKAITAAYLSSGGNAFTTRTANQIIQEHFNPGESQQPSGPLYGVQFSQLACSDVIATDAGSTFGPRPSPLGLSADPGAVPLYKAGVLVGGVGIEVDNRYGIDRDIFDVDANVEEAIAVAGSFRFEAPADVRADRITADGRTLRFVDAVSLASDPSNAPAYASLPGELVGLVPYNVRTLRAGTEFGTTASGVRPAGSDRNGAWILVDASGANRFPVRAGTRRAHIPLGELSAREVDAVLVEALAIARRARAQIRRPLGSPAEVTISVVDPDGVILGVIRTPDAPVFGIDVAVQKARTAAFFSRGGAKERFDRLSAIPAVHRPGNQPVSLDTQVPAAEAFVGPGAFSGTTAWSARAIGNLHRPLFPDGIEATPNGPFSTPMERWSPFNVGYQEDLVYNQILNALSADVSKGCVGRSTVPGTPPPLGSGIFELANGIQIFPGGVPIYRENMVVGAIGVSGDGVDQDDMIAFLGVHNAAGLLGSGIGNAPAAMRADRLAPMGTRLRYVQCPQSPFIDSAEQNACQGK